MVIRGRAVVLNDVSRQVLADSSVDPATWAIREPVYVTGPRGGRYLGIGPWERIIDEVARWDMNLVTIIDRSTSLKYLRPRTRQWQEAAR